MKTTTIRCLLINPYDQTISEVFVEPQFKGKGGFYEVMSGPEKTVDIIEPVQLTLTNDVWVDEEGLLVDQPACYRFAGTSDLILAGRSLVAGNDDEGDRWETEENVLLLASTMMEVEDLEKVIQWEGPRRVDIQTTSGTRADGAFEIRQLAVFADDESAD